MTTKKPGFMTAPAWVNTFYAKFPLVTLDQQDSVAWKRAQTLGDQKSGYTLWVPPIPSSSGEHIRPWASSDPACLRAELLFLLRDIGVQVREWVNPDAGVGGKLPTLHITAENKLVGADEIRGWLDNVHPLTSNPELGGMPDQETYDAALATAQLVLVHLLPALLVSQGKEASLASLMPEPPSLAAGLTMPLPASLTGDSRSVDTESVISGGVKALDALDAKLSAGWALNAKSPTPLDALLASHLYAIYFLPTTSRLRQSLDESSLGTYVDFVLNHADRIIS